MKDALEIMIVIMIGCVTLAVIGVSLCLVVAFVKDTYDIFFKHK